MTVPVPTHGVRGERIVIASRHHQDRSQTSRVALATLLVSVSMTWACSSETSTSRTSSSEAQRRSVAEQGDQPQDDGERGGRTADTVVASRITVGGAMVGDSDTQDDVTACLSERRFFDRFAGEMGACTQLALAKVDCSKSGLLEVMSPKQRQQFQAALAGSYKGWLVDQCVDCPPGADARACKRRNGEPQVGTKVFFVVEDQGTGEVRGKGLLIPVRPGQGDPEARLEK